MRDLLSLVIQIAFVLAVAGPILWFLGTLLQLVLVGLAGLFFHRAGRDRQTYYAEKLQ